MKKSLETDQSSTEAQTLKSTKPGKPFNIDTALTGFMENFAFYCIGVVILYFFVAIPELLKFHAEVKLKHNPFEFWELIFFVIGFMFCLTTFYLLPRLLDSFVRNNLVELKGREEPLEERVTRIINNFHSLLYYSISLGVGLIVTSGTPFRPKMMGGLMDLNKAVENWPQDTENFVRYYFLFSMGHHTERQVNLWTHKRNIGDFWTMNLHHILTVFLMFYSYSMRLLFFGVPVVFIHDISDIMYNVSKICRCVKPFRPFIGISMAVFTLSWLYSRIICYTKEVLLPLKHQITLGGYMQENYIKIGVFEVFCLYILGILNYYWFVLICKIGFNLTRKNDRIINEER